MNEKPATPAQAAALKGSLFPDTEARRQKLARVMERVRACDEVLDEHGLCDCARFIGFELFGLEDHWNAVVSLVDQQAAEIKRLKATHPERWVPEGGFVDVDLD